MIGLEDKYLTIHVLLDVLSFPCYLMFSSSTVLCSSEFVALQNAGNEDRLNLAEAESFATPDSKAKLCSLPWKFWTNFVRVALICHSRGRTKFALLRSWKVTVFSLCSYKVLDIFCSFCFYILLLRTKLSSLCLNFVKFSLEILKTNMFFRIDNNKKFRN